MTETCVELRGEEQLGQVGTSPGAQRPISSQGTHLQLSQGDTACLNDEQTSTRKEGSEEMGKSDGLGEEIQE